MWRPPLWLALGSGEWVSTIPFNVFLKRHAIDLTLTPLPDIRDCYVHGTTSQPLQIGSVSFRPANLRYRVMSGGGRHRWLNLSIDPKHFTALTGLEVRHLRLLPNLLDGAVQTALVLLFYEIINPGMASWTLMKSIVDVVMVDVARILRGTDKSTSAHESFTPAQLSQLMKYVDDDSNPAPTILNISRHLGMSGRHLSRMFKISTGRTIYEYVSQVRIRKAIEMLTTTDMTAKAISNHLRYKSPWGLSEAFQRVTGQTPTEFRRLLKNKH